MRRPASPNRFLSVVLGAALLAGLAMVVLERPASRTQATTPNAVPTTTGVPSSSTSSTTAQSSSSSSSSSSTSTTVLRATTTTAGGSSSTTATRTAGSGAAGPTWHLAWASAAAWGYGVAQDATVRQLVTVALSGQAVRFRLSNVFGSGTLQLTAVTVGVSAGGAAVVPGTLRTVTFGGSTTASIPKGAMLYTDPVNMAVSAGETLAVSLYMPGTDLVTVHPCCYVPQSFFTANGGGNETAYLGAPGWKQSAWSRWVDAADVLDKAPGTIVVVGDSISEGFNARLRWTDLLQQRIDHLPVAQRRAVVNEAITANTLTSYVRNFSALGGGPPGLDRIQADALAQPGVSEVVLFLGTNDLWFGTSAKELIEGYKEAIEEIHRAGLRVIGVTLLPRSSGGTHPVEIWGPYAQVQLEEVDQWILTSGAFDGVINLAPVIADAYDGACDPVAMYPPYDSGDNLHPSDAGQVAIANAINPAVLGLPPLPQLPPLVQATPTPGCNADMPAPPPGAAEMPPPTYSVPSSVPAPGVTAGGVGTTAPSGAVPSSGSSSTVPLGTVAPGTAPTTTPAPVTTAAPVTTPAPVTTAPPTTAAPPVTGNGHP